MTDDKPLDLELWMHIEALYPKGIADLIANYNILKLHVSGASFEDIAVNTLVDDYYIKAALKEYLGAAPRSKRLNFSPLFIFNKHGESNYRQVLTNVADDVILQTLKECILFNHLERKLKEYYDRN